MFAGSEGVCGVPIHLFAMAAIHCAAAMANTGHGIAQKWSATCNDPWPSFLYVYGRCRHGIAWIITLNVQISVHTNIIMLSIFIITVARGILVHHPPRISRAYQHKITYI